MAGAARARNSGLKSLMELGPKSLSVQFLCGFCTILCVSHELSFRLPWASCGQTYGKRPVN